MNLKRTVFALVMVAAASFALVSPVLASADEATEVAAPACTNEVTASDAGGLDLALGESKAPAALPSCGAYDGTACTTPGASFRCQWIPTEPGRCRCSSAFVWVCG